MNSGQQRTAPLGEFQLIERFFKRSTTATSYVALGVGDDCALLQVRADEQWAVSIDTLIEGVHFLNDVDAGALGHKALAVNLSDLAACGATPRCFFLALALPSVDEAWLERFARSLHALADEHACVLAGGDTTRSPSGVSITITALGTVPTGGALLRSGAQVGDDLWVSGELGDATLGLAYRRGEIELLMSEVQKVVARLERPTPRVQLGERLRTIATSAIDISDGLLGDLRHILKASAVGARIEWTAVPRSAVLRAQPMPFQQRCALAGGDDYELLFAAPHARRAEVAAIGASIDVPLTRIGTASASTDLVVLDEHGAPVETDARAFDHFR
ncbi:MAG: thiamine-phosphate kinase [Burkholderiaceae bacterium]